jgi:flavodoxin
MLKKELIISHSATGNTEKVAKIIASELKCDLLKINNNDNSNPGKLSTAITIVKQIIQQNNLKQN